MTLTTLECIFLLLSFFLGGAVGGILGSQEDIELVLVEVEKPAASGT